MSGERVLVVGEDLDTAPKVERLLAQLGFRVVSTRHGPEGARLLRARMADPVRLVVVVCPSSTCRALASFVRRGSRPVPEVPGLMVGGPKGAIELFGLSSFEHEPLPWSPASLTRHVQRMIDAPPSRRPLGRRGVVGSEPRRTPVRGRGLGGRLRASSPFVAQAGTGPGP